VGALHGARRAVVLLGDVRVDLAAFQRRQGELRRDGDRRTQRERDDGQQAQHGQQDAHDGIQAHGSGEYQM